MEAALVSFRAPVLGNFSGWGTVAGRKDSIRLPRTGTER